MIKVIEKWISSTLEDDDRQQTTGHRQQTIHDRPLTTDH